MKFFRTFSILCLLALTLLQLNACRGQNTPETTTSTVTAETPNASDLQPPRPALPIYLATLGPKALEMTGELADGWLGTSFMPEHADVFLEPLDVGADSHFSPSINRIGF